MPYPSEPRQPTGTLVTDPLTTGSVNDAFGTHFDYLGVGGWRALATVSDRDAIPVTSRLESPNSSGQRRRFMRVYCWATDTEYVLNVTDAEWSAATTDAAKIALLADNTQWVARPTTQNALIAPGSITNDNLATDIKVGSLAAAGNAYPLADRPYLTTIERFLVWIGGKLADFGTRITALEARPIGGGTGSGSTNGVNLTAAGDGTKYLANDGQYKTVSAGGGTVKSITLNSQVTTLPDANGNVVLTTSNQVAWDYQLSNLAAPPPIDFRRATTLTLVGKTSSLAGASYAISGGTAQPFVFTNGVDTRSITIPAGGQLVLSGITYAAGNSAGTLFFEGTQS